MAGTLTITEPSADDAPGYDTSTRTISWSFTGSPGSTTQTQRRVVISLENGGPVYDTTLQTSTATTQVVSGIQSNTYYRAAVTVVDSAGATTTVTRRFLSIYSRPLQPLITLTASGANVLIAIVNPAGGSRPAVTTNRVYRRAASSLDPWLYLGAVGAGGTFVDRTVQSNVKYEWFVRALA